jgi:hypothetical protein
MRRGLITTLGLAAVLASGGLAAWAPAATSNNACDSSSSTTSSSTTSMTSTTSTTQTAPSFTPPEPQGSPVNNNTLENCQDATARKRSKLQVGTADATNAQPANYAVAYAHDCATGCQAIAAAFQVALVPKGARTQSPQNVALAVNLRCHHCAVFAYAYQYAVGVPTGTRLSGETRRQIASIARQARADVQANLTFPELDAELQTLASKLRATVDADLQKQHVTETHKHASHHVKEFGNGS